MIPLIQMIMGGANRAFRGEGGNDDKLLYPGYRDSYIFSPVGAFGEVKVVKPNGREDSLDSIEGVWFIDQQEWFSMSNLLNPSPTHTEFQGTSNNDTFQGFLTGQRAFYGNGGSDDKVLYEGSRSDYTFVLQNNDQIFAIKASGEYDILDDLDGVWFLGEQAWYATSDLPYEAPSHEEFQGTPGDDEFDGFLAGQRAFYGNGGNDDKVLYEGYRDNYTFETQSNGQVYAVKENGDFDILDDLDGVWFIGQQAWFSINDLVAVTPSHQEFQGTSGDDEFDGFLTGQRAFYGNGGADDKVLYEGGLSDYNFESQSSGQVFAIKSNGDYDILDDLDGIWFIGQQAWFSINDAVSMTGGGANSTGLAHFGEPVTLVGANLAWSDNSRFGTDIGTNSMNLQGFRDRFDEIQAAGGNSARIWLHTTGQVTPNIGFNGVVSELSSQVSNATVIGQIDDILDEAWSRNLLVTFSLFSFDMMCDVYGSSYGYGGVWQLESSRTMIETEYQSYIDNALLPMVTGVKDHPALFAWEVFNEPEGMIYDPNGSAGIEQFHFCSGGNLTYPLSLLSAQMFVNRVAAAIHSADPNVKVTTSTHTDFFDDFTNSTLTALSGADASGTLDFYEVHHYSDYSNPPYSANAVNYNADRPIVVGEYDLSQVPGNIGGTASINAILDQGYAGAWPWSLTGGSPSAIQNAISDVSASTKTFNKTAIESCIANKPSSCYNN